MVKKMAFFISFFLVFVINLGLVSAYYTRANITQKQQSLLREIETISSPQNQFALSAAPLVLGAMKEEVTVEDGRVENLQRFFRSYNSPLFDHADFIVAASDKYNIDYRLYAAISMQESGGCLKIPVGSHNCTGLGIYGDKVWRFDSFEENIEATLKIIKENYVDRGLITPEAVMSRYTPSSPNGSWAKAVTYFFKALE